MNAANQSHGQHAPSVSVLDFGAAGDGNRDDAPAIQAALDSGAGHVLIPAGTYVIGDVLRPHEGQRLEIHGTVKVCDAVIQPLASDVAVGDSEVAVADASGFRAGQWVTLHDEDLPIQGGGRKTRRQNAGCARIVGVSNNVLKLDAASARPYLQERNAVLATQHSAILIERSNVRVFGTGIIDGNKANQLDAAPSRLEDEVGEDSRAASGIKVNGGPDHITGIVIEGLAVRDAVLHNIAMANATLSAIRNTTCTGAHDKNISLARCLDCSVVNNIASYSEWEDGIIFHQVRDPKHASRRVTVQGNTCVGNPRNGIHVGNNMREIFLAGNLCVDNGLNISIDADNCTSTGDVAIGCNGSLFELTAQRPNTLFSGRRISVANLTALGSPSVAIGVHGESIAILGGVVGDMRPDEPGCDGIGIAVCSRDRYANGRPGATPNGVTISGVTVRGCRCPVLVDESARGVTLRDNNLRGNREICRISEEARKHLALHNNAGLATR